MRLACNIDPQADCCEAEGSYRKQSTAERRSCSAGLAATKLSCSALGLFLLPQPSLPCCE